MKTKEDRLEALIEAYDELVTSSKPKSVDLARYEEDIWNLKKSIAGRGLTKGSIGEKRDWFHENYSGMPSVYETRAAIFRVGEWAHVIFDQIDNHGMKMFAARQCVHMARELAVVHEVPPENTLKAVIEQYKGTPGSIERVRINTNGKKPATPEIKHTGSSKSFKIEMLKSASNFAKESTEDLGVEDVYVKQIVQEFEAGLSRALTDFLMDLTARKKQARNDNLQRIGAIRFNHACEVMCMPSKFGTQLEKRRLQRAYRKRAAPLQRMVDSGNGQAEEELVAVNDAYQLLRDYVKQQG